MALDLAFTFSGSFARMAFALVLGAGFLGLTQPLAAGQDGGDKGLGRTGASIPQGRPYPRIHALFIGINDYASPGLNDFSFAEKDAQKVREILVAKYGFLPEDCRILLGQEASRDRILKAIAQFADDRNVGPADAIFIFLSGHGMSVTRNGSTSGWFVPQGAKISLSEQNPVVLDDQAVSFASMSQTLKLSLARHVLIVADSCYAGSLILDKGAPSPNLVLMRNFAKMGREVLAATGRTATAKENGELGHGHYTYYFLKALRERAASQPFFAKELDPILERAASTATQAPVFGEFASSEGGSFLFSPVGASASPAAAPVSGPAVSPSPGSRLTSLAEAEQAFFAGRWGDASGILEAAAAAGNARAATIRAVMGVEVARDEGEPDAAKVHLEALASLAPLDPAAKYEHATALMWSSDPATQARGLAMLGRAAKELREKAASSPDELTLLYAARSYQAQAGDEGTRKSFAAAGAPGATLNKAQCQAEALKLARRAAQTGSLVSLYELVSLLAWAGDEKGRAALSAGITSLLKSQADRGDVAAFSAYLSRQAPEQASPLLTEKLKQLDPDVSFKIGMDLADSAGEKSAKEVKEAGLRALAPYRAGAFMNRPVGFGSAAMPILSHVRLSFRRSRIYDPDKTVLEAFDDAYLVPQALPFFELASDRGHARASYILGMLLHKSDPAGSLARLKKAADQNEPEACYVLVEVFSGGLLNQAKDGPTAAAFARKGADLGQERCCFWMGLNHEYGHNGLEKNWALARDYYMKGKSWPYAAELYEDGGPGIEKNWQTAHDLYIQGEAFGKAAKLLEEGGFGLAKDEPAAFALRLKQAEKTSFWAPDLEAVAERYEKGILGAPKDTALAIQWWRKAKEKGSKLADEALKLLSSY